MAMKQIQAGHLTIVHFNNNYLHLVQYRLYTSMTAIRQVDAKVQKRLKI